MKIQAAYRERGFDVRVDFESSHYVRLWVSDPQSGQASKVELAADLRSHPPVNMAIGPVAHLDDVAGGKIEALFSRAEARDFIDVDALLTSGRFSREKLLDLATSRDGGFDRAIFAQMLTALEMYPDVEFFAYGLDSAQITGLRRRFADWYEELSGRGPTV